MSSRRRASPESDVLRQVHAALEAEPDWFEGALALGDALQEVGDPLGEFIALHTSLDQAPASERPALEQRAQELLTRHEDAWLGLAPDVRRGLVTLELQWGLVRHARLSLAPGARRRDLRTPLRSLLGAPALRYLRSLELGATGNTSQLLEALASLRVPSLRALSLSTFCAPDEGLIRDVVLGALEPLGRALPNLEHLTVQGRDVTLSGLALPRLRTLDLRLAGARPALLETVDVGTWQKLEHLRLFVSFDEPARGLAVLARLLSDGHLARLRSLGLRYAPSSDALVDMLRTSRLPGLRSLDLTGPALSVTSLRALAHARATALPSLEQVTCLVDGRLPGLDGLVVRAPDDLERGEPASHPDLREPRRVRLSRSMNAGHSVLREDSTQALASFERARVLAEALDDSPARGRALTGSAEAKRLSGRLPEAHADCALAAELLLGREVDLARTLHIHGMVASDLGRHAEARSTLERALKLFKKARDAEGEAYTLQSLALEADGVQDYQRAREFLQAAQRLAKKHSLATLGEHLDRALSLNAQRRGDFDEALRLLRAQADDGDPRVASQNLTNTGTLHWQRGELDLAEQCYREALAVAVKHRLVRQEALAEGNLGHLYTTRADAPSAIVHLERAVTLFRQTGLASGEASALCTLADAHLIANDGPRSQRIADEALQLARTTNNRLCESTANKVLGDLALNDWDGARAMTHAKAALAIDEALGAGQLEGQALCWAKLSFAHLVLGNFKDARAAAAKTVKLRAGSSPSRGWSEANLALIEYGAGAFPAAVEACVAALARGRSDDAALGRRVNAYQAAALARAGDLLGADSALAAARAFAPGAHWDEQSTEQLEICRAVVEHERRALEGSKPEPLSSLRRPVSYEGRLFYERLIRPQTTPAPGGGRRPRRQSGR